MGNERFLERIEEFISDQEKIVTCKWLSKELAVDLNTARSLLQNYIQDGKRKSRCTIVYLCVVKHDQGTTFAICKENDVPALKKGGKEIIAQQIYSLQKCIDDLHLLFEVDRNIRFEPSIKYPTNNVRKEKFWFETDDGKNKTVPVSNRKEEKETEKEKTEKAKPTSSPHKQESLKKEVSVKNGTSVQQSPSKKGRKKQVVVAGSVKSISDMFAKQAQRKKEETVREDKEHEKTTPGTNIEDDSVASKDSENGGQEEEEEMVGKIIPDKKKEASKAAGKSEDKKQPKKRSAAKKTKDKPKKRKRILLQSDSESEENAEDNDQEIDLEPEIEPPPSPTVPAAPEPAVIISHGRKRKRKVIEKTAADAEGFLHTTKEVIYESCSSEDDDLLPIRETDIKKAKVNTPEKDEQKENVKNKTQDDTSSKKPKTKGKNKNDASSTNTKQASILNFFKKK